MGSAAGTMLVRSTSISYHLKLQQQGGQALGVSKRHHPKLQQRVQALGVSQNLLLEVDKRVALDTLHANRLLLQQVEAALRVASTP